MRPPPLPLSIAAGLAVGALLATGGFWLGERTAGPPAASPVAVVSTSAPAVGTDPTRWVAPHETVLGPTVLVPTAIAARPGEVELSYRLVDIAPPPVGDPGPNAEQQVVSPETWTLLTDGGPVSGASATTRARTARFAVPAGFDPATITGARIESWRMRMPVHHVLEIAQDDTTEHPVEVGTAIALRFVLPQPQNTLVQFRIVNSADSFSAATGSFSAAFEARPQLSGIGPGWTNVGNTDSGGVQLTYVGEELLDPFPLLVESHQWVRMTSSIDVDLAGVLDG